MNTFCSECGSPRDTGRRFCTSCGAAFGSDEDAASAPASVPAPALAPASAPAPATPAPPSPTTVPPLAAPSASSDDSRATSIDGIARVQLAGVVIAVLSVYFPWAKFPGISLNAYEVPALLLLDPDTSTGGVEVGLLVVVLAGIVLADLFVRSPWWSKVAFGAGIAEIVIGILFIIQLPRSPLASSQSLGDVVGLAPLATIAAGAMITFVTARSRASISPSE